MTIGTNRGVGAEEGWLETVLVDLRYGLLLFKRSPEPMEALHYEWVRTRSHSHPSILPRRSVSIHFINSEFCYDTELERVRKRHEAGQARVVPNRGDRTATQYDFVTWSELIEPKRCR